MKYREGNWLTFCDICGQRCYASNASKLPTYTGRGGLIVCNHDVDAIDPGLIPYRIPIEKNVPWIRINHTDTTNSSPIVDLETMTITAFLASSQDEIVLTPSQTPSELFIVSTSIL